MTVYTVRLKPPTDVDLRGRSDVAALFSGPIDVRVKSGSRGYAAIKGLAMVPWIYVQPFAATVIDA